MSGKRAKEIRRKVYGDYSIRVRHYYRFSNGQIVSGGRRKEYQNAKVY